MLKKENRNYFLNQFLLNIKGISDVDYQKRVWIRGEGSECDDFDETVCYFFETVDSILNDYKDYEITEAQYHLLKKFRENFESFSDKNHWPPFFINTPEWAKIMKMAKDVLRAFNYDKNKSTET